MAAPVPPSGSPGVNCCSPRTTSLANCSLANDCRAEDAVRGETCCLEAREQLLEAMAAQSRLECGARIHG